MKLANSSLNELLTFLCLQAAFGESTWWGLNADFWEVINCMKDLEEAVRRSDVECSMLLYYLTAHYSL